MSCHEALGAVGVFLGAAAGSALGTWWVARWRRDDERKLAAAREASLRDVEARQRWWDDTTRDEPWR